MSIYAQDWDDLELVAIDDYSTDGSFAIAERFSEISWVRSRFSRIVIERNPRNMGAALTINTAIQRSTGDVVMIVNSDDKYHPHRVTSCVEAIRGGARFVFTGIRCIDENGDDALTDEAAYFEKTVAEIARYPTVSLAMVEKNRAISTGNFCFTRELAMAVGLFQPLLYCHDWDFVLSTILETEPCWINEPYYEYRLHGLNSFRSLAAVAESDSRACFQRFFQAIDRRLIHNPMLHTYINEQTLWEGILGRAGAIARAEWIDAKSGIIRRPISIGGRRGTAAEASEATTVVITSIEESLQSRLSTELFLTGVEGDIYPDGWIGEDATLSFQVGPDARRVELALYLGRGTDQRIVVSTLCGPTGLAGEHMVVALPGERIVISFDLESAARSFAVNIRVPNAMPVGSDRRKLGVVIHRFNIIDERQSELPPHPAPDRKPADRATVGTSRGAVRQKRPVSVSMN